VYSPDGQRLLFMSDRSGNSDLWELTLQTGAVRRITDDAAEDQDPAYTPDGKRIIWNSNRSGQFEVWMADADGNAARRLTDHRNQVDNPTATPDGWVVHGAGDSKGPGIWKVRQDGSGATLLARTTRGLYQTSPDGRYVVRQIRRGSGSLPGHIIIQTFQVSDGAIVPFEISFEVVRPGRGLLGRSRFMPDGKAIAFLGQDEKGTNGIFVQDFVPGQDTSRTRRPLGGFDPEMIAESFGISPDGSRMTVAAWEPMFSTMLADHVPDITPARTRSR
jgi:Tol biopolymer transport system component